MQDIICVITGVLLVFNKNNPLTDYCDSVTTVKSNNGNGPSTSLASDLASSTIYVDADTSVAIGTKTTLTVPDKTKGPKGPKTSTSTTPALTTSTSTSSGASTTPVVPTTTSTSSSTSSTTPGTPSTTSTSSTSSSSPSTSSSTSTTSPIKTSVMPTTSPITTTPVSTPGPSTSSDASTSSSSSSSSSSSPPASPTYNAFACPADLPLSCSNTTAIADTCCFESPGGLILQTQFWDTASSGKAVGPNDTWTIHGLWPDNCDGTYASNCDPKRAYMNITQLIEQYESADLLATMNTLWLPNSGTAESFWEHEWAKHGTCMSTFDTQCIPNYTPGLEAAIFFNKTVEVYESLPTFDWLAEANIVPSTTVQYTIDQVVAAVAPHHGGKQAYFGCSGGQLDEAWYYFHVQGSVETGNYVPTDLVGGQGCPASFYYYPKDYVPPTTTTPTATTGNPSTASAGPTTVPYSNTGIGYFYVYPTTTNVKTGNLISGGTYYNAGGTPAGYTVYASATTPGLFALKTSKGFCAFDANSLLSCAATITQDTASLFGNSGLYLTYNGSPAFSTTGVPAGTAQAPVYAGAVGSLGIQIQWQSKTG